MPSDAYTQDNRPLAIDTPLGKDKLLLESITGFEAVSEPFLFHLELLAPSESPVVFEQLLNQKVTATMWLTDQQTKRYFHGVITRLSQGRPIRGTDGQLALIRYTAELRPQFWLLTRESHCRIFQNQSVPDILATVLTGIEISNQIQGTFEPRDYCVQYRESDFAFASRLMEEEGIFYYFQHAQGSHKMVLGNTPQCHQDLQPSAQVKFKQVGAREGEMCIYGWEKSQELRSVKTTLWDYTFEMPDNNLEAAKQVSPTSTAGTVSHQLAIGPAANFEQYDYPGSYAHRFAGVDASGGDQASNLQKIFQDNVRTAGIRMEQEAVTGLLVIGAGSVRYFTAGGKFTLQEHFNGDGAYVLTRVEHAASQEGTYTTEIGRSLDYQNQFRCIPADLPFRPQRLTPKARVEGVQTAKVVGPAGQEIFTDKYGRVKVQFKWDRDAKQSCWLRVGTLWAGQQWGVVHIPRIGQEVIVAFLEGDPDQPIVVGSVYNASLMPPYTLPDNMTQSGIKSRSTPQGAADNFNEIRFEDKKGEELVNVQAEKDMTRLVKNDDTLTVKGKQTITITKDRTEEVSEGNETITIKKGNRTEEVTEGNETITIKKGNRTTEISQGNEALTVSQGNATTEVKAGDYTLKVGANKLTIANAGQASLETTQSIELKVGANSVKIDTSGIVLTVGGTSIKLSATGIEQTAAADSLKVGPAGISVSASAQLELKGAIVKIN